MRRRHRAAIWLREIIEVCFPAAIATVQLGFDVLVHEHLI